MRLSVRRHALTLWMTSAAVPAIRATMSWCGGGQRSDDVAETVAFLGGIAGWRELRDVHPARLIRRLGRRRCGASAPRRAGTSCRPPPQQLVTAQSRSATLSHVSAAVHHGWKVKAVPDAAWVTVPRNRRLRAEQRAGIRPRWADLGPDDVRHGVTTPLRTVLDCARALPFDEALAVADSALRARGIARAELREAAARAARARRPTGPPSGRPRGPVERPTRSSPCSARSRSRRDSTSRPQLQIADSGLFAVVDLGSEELRLAVEADGFEHHGTRRGPAQGLPPPHRARPSSAGPRSASAFEDVMCEPALGALGPALLARRAGRPGARRPTAARL